MINRELRRMISEDYRSEDSIMLDEPSFDGSVIGITHDGSIVYDYSRMITEMSLEEDITAEEAEDFIQYNTIRAIPYMPDPRPVVIIPLCVDRE